MLSGSSNLLIAGGSFVDKRTSHYHGTKARGIDILLEISAPGAFHNSGERFDPPKCHPTTRTHILNKIMHWVVGKVGWDGFIKWLYGPAGAGKSAIAQTIAEMCHARHLLLASFFFSRTDPKRNNEKCLIASIAYQIALNARAVTRRAIEAAVEKDPAIFQRSIEAQLKTLIINPLTQRSKTRIFRSNPIPNLIIIDGLDECNDHRVQQHILHIFSIALQQPDVPLKILICSRKEPHLTREFTSLISNGMATRLSLEDGYEQNADIARYLLDSFHKIATTHPLKATTVKYISSNRHHPARHLEIILGIQPSRNGQPFAELDALYMGILSFVEDVKVTLQLLGVLILADLFPQTPEVVGEFMFLDLGEVERLLLDLASVVECLDMKTPIRMLHASFPDFLFDRSRSAEYYIDASMMHTEISQLCLSHIEVHESVGCVTCLEAFDYVLRRIIRHLSQSGPSDGLREALLNTCYITVLIKRRTLRYSSRITDLLAEFLFFLKSSKFTDTENLYLHHRNIYDRIMRQRIADFPLDFGSIVGLALAGLHPNIGLWKFDKYFTHYFPAIKGGLLLIYEKLHSRSLDYFPDSLYLVLLTEFLTDPGRAGEHALGGPKFARVAKLLLDCFIPPCLDPSFIRYFDIYDFSRISSETRTLLSKASHSDELVARINHADINCESFTFQLISHKPDNNNVEEGLRTLIKGIGDYLTRVVGSAPMDLKITLRVASAITSVYPSVTFGPFYYEGQGQGMAKCEEEG